MDDAEFIKSVDSKFEPLVKAAEEMTQHAKKRSAEISQQIKSLELEMVCPAPTSCDATVVQ